jgi:DDHD domain
MASSDSADSLFDGKNFPSRSLVFIHESSSKSLFEKDSTPGELNLVSTENLPPLKQFPEKSAFTFKRLYRTDFDEPPAGSFITDIHSSPSESLENSVTGSFEAKSSASVSLVRAESALHDKVDYIFLFVHGIGSNETHLSRNIEDFKEVLESVRVEKFLACNVQIELINWKLHVVEEQTKILGRILPPIRDSQALEFRKTINNMFSDIGYYFTAQRKAEILNIVRKKINSLLESMKLGDPRRYGKSKIVLIGFSLGSVIVHDLLSESKIDHPVHGIFLLGSPLASLLSLSSGPNDSLPDFTLPNKVPIFFNLFHELDPVAFRLEPLFYKEFGEDIAHPVIVNFGNKSSGWWGGSSTGDGRSEEDQLLARKKRIDYVLPAESSFSLALKRAVSVPLAMGEAHCSYWRDERVSLFILKNLVVIN